VRSDLPIIEGRREIDHVPLQFPMLIPTGTEEPKTAKYMELLDAAGADLSRHVGVEWFGCTKEAQGMVRGIIHGCIDACQRAGGVRVAYPGAIVLEQPIAQALVILVTPMIPAIASAPIPDEFMGNDDYMDARDETVSYLKAFLRTVGEQVADGMKTYEDRAKEAQS
jgi:hypothetical protein